MGVRSYGTMRLSFEGADCHEVKAQLSIDDRSERPRTTTTLIDDGSRRRRDELDPKAVHEGEKLSPKCFRFRR